MKPIFLPRITLLLCLTSSTLAQENGELGRMWTFENPPLAYLEKEYGFKPGQKWLTSLRLGSLRLGGEDILHGFGSASFVSPNGLILTSTRSVPDVVTWPGLLHLKMVEKTGFVAAALEKETRLRSRRRDMWLTAAQLVKTSNVTAAVNDGVTPTHDEARIRAKRESNKHAILDVARRTDPALVPQIVSLYQGGIFQLYQYRVYDDVRLVCMPHLQAAHFGRDPDNFNYPRHSIDFAFLRAYEDGKPADTAKHYFKWKSGGARNGELVFVSGNPGTTKRLLTKAQLEFERDIKVPMQVEWLKSNLRIRKEFDVFHGISSQTRTIGLENSLKAARGKLNGLQDAKLMAQKTAAEVAFKRRVMADEKLAEKYGDLWDRIASVIKERRLHEARARFHTTAGLVPLNPAITIVRSCDPAETEEYRKRAKREIEGWGDRGAGNPAFEIRARFVDHVVRARGWLPKDDPFFSKVLGGRSGEAFLEAVVGKINAGHRGGPKLRSLVYYPEKRRTLVKSGWKGIQESEDAAIVAARELVILMRRNEKLSEELDAKEEALGAEIGRALFACYGTNVGSDGTMTPRFTDGIVRGFPLGGTISPHRVAPYRTVFHGLYARNAAFDNEYPFNLPKTWLDRKDEIDMTKPVNFVSTNDTTRGSTAFETLSNGIHCLRYSGGNSGSVVVNKALEVVGVVVDGNIESLHNGFVFKDDVPRAVSVHVDGIMEALVNIYDAQRVAKELAGK